MKNDSAASTSEVDTITRMANYARADRTTVYWLLLSPVPAILSMVLMAVNGVTTADTQESLYTPLSALPFFLIVAWMCIRQERMHRACRQFNKVLGPEHHKIWPTISPAAIGPLLEATMTIKLDGNYIAAPTDLLCFLLESLRAEDEVRLTPTQLSYLHELLVPERRLLVSPGNAQYGDAIIKEMHREARPAAIRAVTLLGNNSSIPVLERFADMTDDLELRRLALESLDQIRERLKYGPEQMLRAARAPEHPDTLLRAASDQTQSNAPHQLLRAGAADTALHPESLTPQTGGQALPTPNAVTSRTTQPQSQQIRIGNDSTA